MSAPPADTAKVGFKDDAMKEKGSMKDGVDQYTDDAASSLYHNDHTHRNLKNRHIQLIAIGGTIGTALFVQIGSGLIKGGPASLFVAFTIWCTFIIAINNCLSEMVTWMPITSPFTRFAEHFVDPAMGFCAGVNFFVFQCVMMPFEITAFNIILHFWTDKIPLPAVIVFMLVSYIALNIITVKYYGGALPAQTVWPRRSDWGQNPSSGSRSGRSSWRSGSSPSRS